MRTFLMALLISGISFILPQNVQANETAFWDEFRNGKVIAMMRHAIAPGVGDPDDFELRKCETQRNLSDEGREQARNAGAFFKAKSVGKIKVFSSQWCRCLETANLLGSSDVEELEALNSFFGDEYDRADQMENLHKWLSGFSSQGPVVLVTHQVNITGLTGVYPASGEVIFFKKEDGHKVKVVKRLLPSGK